MIKQPTIDAILLLQNKSIHSNILLEGNIKHIQQPINRRGKLLSLSISSLVFVLFLFLSSSIHAQIINESFEEVVGTVGWVTSNGATNSIVSLNTNITSVASASWLTGATTITGTNSLGATTTYIGTWNNMGANPNSNTSYLNSSNAGPITSGFWQYSANNSTQGALIYNTSSNLTYTTGALPSVSGTLTVFNTTRPAFMNFRNTNSYLITPILSSGVAQVTVWANCSDPITTSKLNIGYNTNTAASFTGVATNLSNTNNFVSPSSAYITSAAGLNGLSFASWRQLTFTVPSSIGTNPGLIRFQQTTLRVFLDDIQIIPYLSNITTGSLGAVTNTSATIIGNVLNNCSQGTVSASGIAYSTTSNGESTGTKTTDGPHPANGTFNSTITGLTPNTTYFVKAYATNPSGTFYENELSFTTASNTFYYASTLTTDITDPNAWWSISGGTGNHPYSMTAAGLTLNVLTTSSSTTMTTSLVLGSGTVINVGGVSAGTLSIPSNFSLTGGTINVAANGILNIANTTMPTLGTLTSGSEVVYNGTSNQTIPVYSYSKLTVSNSGGAVATTANAMTIASVTTVSAGSILATSSTFTTTGGATINGSFQLNGGGWATSGTWTYGAAGTLIFNNATGSYGVNSDVFWPSTSGPVNVTVAGAGGITMNVSRTVTGVIQTVSGITNANNLTINGTFQINAGGYATGVPTYGGSSTLIYNTTSYTTTGNEFPATGVNNVTITTPSTTNTVTFNADKTISGTLSVGANIINGGKSITAATITVSTGTLTMGNITISTALTCSGAAAINLSGNWSVTGFTKSTSTVSFTGTGSINNATSFYNLTNSSGTRSITQNIDVANTLSVSGGQIGVTGSTGRSLTMSGSAGLISIAGGAIYGTDAGTGNDLSLIISGTLCTISGNATSSNDDEKKFFNVTVNSGSTLSLSRGILCKYGTFTCNGTIQINANGYIQSLSGVAPAYHATTGFLVYNNNGTYTTASEWPSTNAPFNVTIQNSSLVTLSGSRTITGTLTLTSGSLTLGANNLTLTSTSAVAGTLNTTNHIITNSTGYVQGTYSTGAYTFPVGFDASDYNPATITNSAATAQTYTVRALAITPSLTNSVKSMWSIGGISATSSAVAIAWNSTNDAVASAPTIGTTYQYNGSAWVLLGGSTSGTTPNYTTTVSGLSSLTNSITVAPATAPTVTTTSAGSITSTTSSSGGNVTSDGGSAITERGIVYSTSTNPTVTDTKVTAAGTTGSYTSSLTSLTAGTTYHFRAYAINTIGTSYGSDVSFTTLAVPTVTTTAASSIATTSASSGGNVTADGGATVTERGIVYSISSNPTTVNTKVIDGSTGTGSYASSLTSLATNTVYHIRAYAINTVGTSYGSDVSFTSLSNAPTMGSATSIGTSGFTANWTAPSNGGAATITYTINMSADNTFTTGVTTFSSVAGTSQAFTGLSAGTIYYYRISAVNAGGSSAYSSNGSVTTLSSLPSTATTGLNFTAYTTSSISLSWTNGNGANRIVVVKSGSTPTDPTSGSTYTASATFGSGTTTATGSYVVYKGSGSSTTVTGLTAGTTYYFAVYELNGSAGSENYLLTSPASGNQATLSAEPTTQASAINFTSVAGTAFTINWTNGNGTNRIVLLKDVSAVNSNPVDGTSYTSNTVFASGSQIGTGNYVVYNGTGSSVTVTGLTNGHTYYTAVYEFNGATTQVNYLLTPATGSQLTANTASIVTVGTIADFGLVAVGSTSSESTFTVSGTSLSANLVVTAPTGFEVSKTTGTGFATSISFTPSSGIVTSQTVYVHFIPSSTGSFSANIANTSTGAITQNVAVTGTAIATLPSTSANSVVFSSIATTSYIVGWTSGNGSKRIVIASTSPIGDSPTDNVAYTASATYGSGNAIGACYVVYNGTGNSVSVTGLTSGTVYYFAVYEYNDDGSNGYSNYNLITSATGNRATLSAEPTVQASNVIFSAITDTTATVNWTIGNGSKHLVIVRQGSAIATNPTDGTTYGSPSSVYAQGDAIGSGYVAYLCTCNSFTLTGLNPNTTYYVAVYELNGSYGSENFLLTSPATGNFTTLVAAPTVQASAVNFSSITNSSFNINFTVGNGTNRIVEIKSGSSVNSDPVDGTSYTANTVMGSGSLIGTGNYVVYTGTSNTVSVTGLNPGTTYYVAIYEFNGSGGTENYLFTPATGNQTTTSTPTLITSTTTSITGTTATSGGNVSSDGGLTVTERGIVYSTSATPTTSDTKVINGTGGTGTFTSSITGLSLGTTYHVRAYAINSAGTSYGGDTSFTTLSLPTLTTTAISAVISITASSGGTISSNGGSAVTAEGVCWSTSSNPTIADSKTIDGTATPFTSSITGLTINTTYHVRAYATTSVGTNYGSDVSFTTANIPTVSTTAISSINTTTAVSGGTVSSNGGLTVTAEGVCWSTSSNPTIADSKTTDGTASPFTSNLTGLTINTTYYVRAYATNSAGTAYGNEVTFITANIPTVTTTSISSIATTTASSGGTVTNNGGLTITAEGICWSTSINPTTADSKTTDGTATPFTSSLTALTANTTYHVRAYATNSAGTAYGSDISFTTSATKYYFVAGGSPNLADPTQWFSNSDGSGNSPSVFTVAGVTYQINSNATTTAAWTVSGSGSVITVGDPSVSACTLTISSSFAITGTINVAAASSGTNKLVLQNTTLPTFGIFNAASTLEVQNTFTFPAAPSGGYGHLIVSSGNVTIPGSVTINGDFTISNGGIVTLNNNSGKNLTIAGNMNLSGSGGITFVTGQTSVFSLILTGSGKTITNTATGNNFSKTNITFNNGASYTLASNFDYSLASSSRSITTNSGTSTLDIGAYTLNMGTSVLSVTNVVNNSILGVINTACVSTTSITPIPSGKTWSGTINYNASGLQTVVAGAYHVLMNSGTSASVSTTATSGTISVDTFIIAGGKGLTPGGSTLSYNANGTLICYGGSVALTATSPEWPATNGPKNVTVRSNILSFTASAGIYRTIPTGGTLTLDGGNFTVNTGDSLTFANGSNIIRSNPTSSSMNGSTFYNFGASSSDVVNVYILSSVTTGNELPSSTASNHGGKIALNIADTVTYTLSSSKTSSVKSVNFTGNNGTGVIDATSVSNYGFYVFGDITGVGSFINGTVTMTSGSANISGVTFKSLTINNSSIINLTGSPTINGTLTFTAGKITTGSNTLNLASTATVSGAGSGKYVYGNLKKFIPASATTATFEVGDASVYAPITTVFTGTISAATGSITATTVGADHPSIATSGLNSTSSINRYWTLTNNTAIPGLTTYSPTFTFVAGDLDAGVSTSSLSVRLYSASTWYSTTTGTLNSTNSQATGLTSFGDFAIGQLNIAPAIVTNPSNSSVCNGSSTSFTAAVSSAIPTPTVQWKRNANNGLGYITLNGSTDGGIYTGTTSNTLTISSVSNTLNGYTYQAVYTNINGTATTTAATLTVTSNIWTGSVNTSWINSSNWSCSLPGTTDNIIIPASLNNYPIISSSTSIAGLSIANGASLTITSSLNISGNINNSGTLTASAGTITLNGSSTQTVAGSFTVKNLAMNNTSGGVAFGSTSADTVYVTGVYTPTSGKLTTNGRLVLVSDANGTASVAAGTGNYISGDVTVQRYHSNKRAWLMLTAPLTTYGSNKTGDIRSNWQQNTYITGPQANTPYGLDSGTNTSYSIIYWNGTTWGKGISTNTSLTTSSNNTLFGGIGGSSADNKAFFLYVRGDRSIKPAYQGTNSTAVTFRASGSLQTGDKNFALSSGSYSLVANPYAAPIDLDKFRTDNTGLATNGNVTFYYWDPNLSGTGGYVTAQYLGGSWNFSSQNASNTKPRFIQSGQAFFVLTNGQTSVAFKESQKTTDSSTNSVFGSSTTGKLKVELNKGTNMVDGVLTLFNNSFSAAVNIPAEDALKLWGNEENIGILRNGNYLSIEARPEIGNTDTSFLYMYKLIAGTTYNFNISTSNLPTNAQGYLIDKYLNTQTALNLSVVNNITFNVDTSAASKSPIRFLIVFNNSNPLSVNGLQIKASVKAKAAVIDWNVMNEIDVDHYEVERSREGVSYVKIATNSSNNITNSSYTFTDNQADKGANYYRIKAISKDGTIQYSSVAKVTIGDKTEGISVFPNPVTGKNINIILNNITAGKYTVSMYNANGQQILEQVVQHAGGSVTTNLSLPSNFAAGIYQLQLTGSDKTYTETVIVK